MNCQSRFDAWYRMLGAGALGWPRGMVWGGRWEGGSGWGTHVHPWWIHVSVWQNQYKLYSNKPPKKQTNETELRICLWENGIETCILSYVKRIASPGSMHDTGCSGLVHWGDPEGWDGMGREVGGGFRMGNTCTPVVDSCQCMAKPIQYCKVINLQLK